MKVVETNSYFELQSSTTQLKQFQLLGSKTRKMAQLKADREQSVKAVIGFLTVECNLLDKISFPDTNDIFSTAKSEKCL
jgi:hypothetical protein